MNKETMLNPVRPDWFNKVTINKVPGAFQFTEGPVWHPDGFFLFSDTPANCIYRLSLNGKTELFLDKSGFSGGNATALSDQLGSNGLAWGSNKRLFICQHGNHAIAALAGNELNIVTGAYDDAPFNSPNDIVLRSDGIIYFTDPPYGLAGQVLHPSAFQPLAGVYKYDGFTTELVGKELQYPNGICFSPGEDYLYVSSNHPEERYILKYCVKSDGALQYDGILIKENADGIKIDQYGNLCMATAAGIFVVSPLGEKLGLISLPGMATNLAWGGQEGTLLCVTAASNIYLLNIA